MFNECCGFGEYIHAGQDLYWAGTVDHVEGFGAVFNVDPWPKALEDFRNKVAGEGFSITGLEQNQNAGSIAVNVIAPIDFGDSNDVKGLIDGIANEAGFRLRASMIRAGARPLATPTPAGDPLGTAASFWGSEIGQTASTFWQSLTSSEGSGSGLMLALVVVGAILLLRK